MIVSHALALIAGLTFGAAAGWHTRATVCAWCDYRAAQKTIPILLAAAFTVFALYLTVRTG